MVKMSATKPVDWHKKNRFLEIHDSKLKSVKRFEKLTVKVNTKLAHDRENRPPLNFSP